MPVSRQMTHKVFCFGYICCAISVWFVELLPQRIPVPPQSRHKQFKKEARGCHQLPRRSQKGPANSPGADFLVEIRFWFSTSSTWCSRHSLGSPQGGNIKMSRHSFRNQKFLWHSHTHATTGFCFNLRGRNSSQATEIRRTSFRGSRACWTISKATTCIAERRSLPSLHWAPPLPPTWPSCEFTWPSWVTLGPKLGHVETDLCPTMQQI